MTTKLKNFKPDAFVFVFLSILVASPTAIMAQSNSHPNVISTPSDHPSIVGVRPTTDMPTPPPLSPSNGEFGAGLGPAMSGASLNGARINVEGMAQGQGLSILSLDTKSQFSALGLSEIQAVTASNIVMPAGFSFAQFDQASVSQATIAQGNEASATSEPSLSPEFEQRIAMARRLMKIDGTEELVRHYVNSVHMKLIINKVNEYININNLSESDRYRMAAIANNVAVELGDRIMNLYARQHAQNLSVGDLTQLISDMDVEAQKKLTRLRMSDDGSLDKQASLEMQLAQLQIIKSFESQ